jgi:predicted RNA-binding Zn-ribbon protein involved in translation (DUF1610 family)
MWNCTSCGEEVEDNFEACWNCQTTKGGRRSGNSTAPASDEDDQLRALVNRKHKPMACLRCGRILQHTGTRKFHEGPNFGVLGDFGELLVSQQGLEMYVCPECGHVEFFAFAE